MAIGPRRQNRLTSTSLTLLCLAASLCLEFAQCGYAAEPPLEYQVEAAFLLNFTKFTEWPASAFSKAGSPFAICILGNDPFGQALDQIVSGESVNGHPVTVLRLDDPPQPQTCQLVFLSSHTADLPKILRAVGSGVLTVGDRDGFVRAGGMIGFVIENRRVRFDINQAAADGAGLKLSSRLLNVARSVKK